MLNRLFNLEYATDKDYSFTHRKPTIVALISLFSGLLLIFLLWLLIFASPEVRYNEAVRIMYYDSGLAEETVEKLDDDYKDTRQLKQYISALKLSDVGIFDKAIAEFSSLGEYRDSVTQLAKTKYSYAEKLALEGSFDDAYELFIDSEYEDYEVRAKDTLYTAALVSSDLKTSAEYMSRVFGYKDADNMYLSYMYAYASNLNDNGDIIGAAKALSEMNSVGNFNDSVDFEHKLWYEAAISAADAENYSDAKEYILLAVDYPTAETVEELSAEYSDSYTYNLAVEYMNNEEYIDAIALFDTITGFKDADDLNAQCEREAYNWTFDGFLSTDGTEATKTTKFTSADTIYVVGTLSGGKPDKEVDLVFTWTDSKKRTSTCVINDWVNNTHGGCYFTYSHPKNADDGKSKITVSIEETDEIIATFEFKVSVAN